MSQPPQGQPAPPQPVPPAHHAPPAHASSQPAQQRQPAFQGQGQRAQQLGQPGQQPPPPAQAQQQQQAAFRPLNVRGTLVLAQLARGTMADLLALLQMRFITWIGSSSSLRTNTRVSLAAVLTYPALCSASMRWASSGLLADLLYPVLQSTISS